ncbi:MAG: hypothetical protein CO022_00975 [Flavobacteriales bacterium CG_4_9_14_0_2_um_filter_32_27]|nr:MAG: hypothetical protein CO022_00975 [Flavobacteriales bacterium CG_4_9_14_0_2_um_filter_32_27]
MNYSDTLAITINGVDEFLSDDFHVYPNPTSNMITIEFNQKDIYSYTLSTILGKVVNTQILTPNLQQIQINMHHYNDGIYFLTLFENAGNMIKIIKIIKN